MKLNFLLRVISNAEQDSIGRQRPQNDEGDVDLSSEIFGYCNSLRARNPNHCCSNCADPLEGSR